MLPGNFGRQLFCSYNQTAPANNDLLFYLVLLMTMTLVVQFNVIITSHKFYRQKHVKEKGRSLKL